MKTRARKITFAEAQKRFGLSLATLRRYKNFLNAPVELLNQLHRHKANRRADTAVLEAYIKTLGKPKSKKAKHVPPQPPPSVPDEPADSVFGLRAAYNRLAHRTTKSDHIRDWERLRDVQSKMLGEVSAADSKFAGMTEKRDLTNVINAEVVEFKSSIFDRLRASIRRDIPSTHISTTQLESELNVIRDRYDRDLHLIITFDAQAPARSVLDDLRELERNEQEAGMAYDNATDDERTPRLTTYINALKRLRDLARTASRAIDDACVPRTTIDKAWRTALLAMRSSLEQMGFKLTQSTSLSDREKVTVQLKINDLVTCAFAGEPDRPLLGRNFFSCDENYAEYRRPLTAAR